MSDVGSTTAVLTLLLVPLQILVVDLLLSADNALMIAMACRGLPEADVRLVTMLGTAGAVALRLVLAAMAALLLQMPYLKLLGGAALLLIAVRLTLAPSDDAVRSALDGTGAVAGAASPSRIRRDLLGAVGTIVAADAVMSLDNVVAIAAIAGGNLLLLAAGLALSIPMLVWGSTLIRHFLDENAILVLLSGMFLGWLAGSIGVSDPSVGPWIADSAPALPYAVPLACAVFVLWQNLILAPRDLRQESADD